MGPIHIQRLPRDNDVIITSCFADVLERGVSLSLMEIMRKCSTKFSWWDL